MAKKTKMVTVNQQEVDKHLAAMIDVVLSTRSRAELDLYYQSLTLKERADIMAYMKTATQDELYRRVRNQAENLAR